MGMIIESLNHEGFCLKPMYVFTYIVGLYIYRYIHRGSKLLWRQYIYFIFFAYTNRCVLFWGVPQPELAVLGIWWDFSLMKVLNGRFTPRSVIGVMTFLEREPCNDSKWGNSPSIKGQRP